MSKGEVAGRVSGRRGGAGERGPPRTEVGVNPAGVRPKRSGGVDRSRAEIGPGAKLGTYSGVHAPSGAEGWRVGGDTPRGGTALRSRRGGAVTASGGPGRSGNAGLARSGGVGPASAQAPPQGGRGRAEAAGEVCPGGLRPMPWGGFGLQVWWCACSGPLDHRQQLSRLLGLKKLASAALKTTGGFLGREFFLPAAFSIDLIVFLPCRANRAVYWVFLKLEVVFLFAFTRHLNVPNGKERKKQFEHRTHLSRRTRG